MFIPSLVSASSSLCNYHSPAAILSVLSPLKTSRIYQKLLFHSIAGTLALYLLTTPFPTLSLSPTTTITKPSDAHLDLCIEEHDSVIKIEADEKRSESITNVELAEEAWEVVNDSYIGNRNWSPELWKKKKEYMINGSSIKTRDRVHDVIKKMLESLGDPYTRFIPRSEFLKMARYDITGIGINLREVPGANGDVKLKVLGIILDGPAHSAGVRQGDELLSVNGVDVKGKSAFDVSTMLQGPNETFVTIEVRHGNCGQIQSFKVQRQSVARTPVYYRLEKAENGNASFGYINIKEFNALATKDLIIALKRLQQSGAFYFVLDLRDNLGGLVQAGIEISKLFLNKGETVIYTVGRDPEIQKSIRAESEPFISSPVAVLVNNRTASASEIVATALHDNCKAVIVGEKTYGKGLIQSVFELHDGSGVVVTIGKYVTPNHKDINDVGIEPDFPSLPDVNEIREALSRCKIQRIGVP